MKKLFTIAALLVTAVALKADFTLISGDYKVIFSAGVNYAPRNMSYKNWIFCNSNGYNSPILAPAHVKFIGAGHREGGREKLVSLLVNVDGKNFDEPYGNYTGKTLVFTRVTRLDNTELTCVFTVTAAGVNVKTSFKTVAEQKVASFYVQQYCFDVEARKAWAKLANNTVRTHEFPPKGSWFLHNVALHATAFALYNEKVKLGVAGVYDAATVKNGHSRFWGRVNTNKLYYQPRFDKVLPAGYTSPVYNLTIKCFAAEPGAWQQSAEAALK